MERYNHEFTIIFRDVDMLGNLTIHALIDFMQETSRNHAEILGINYSALVDDYYWIILRTKVQLNIVPQIGQKIRIETFIEGLERLYSVRRFNIYDEDDQCLGYIIGYYLLMEQEHHMPVRLKSLEGKEHIFMGKYEGEKVKKLQDKMIEVVRSTERMPYSCDIDANTHMNNAYYVRWVIDTFTVEELWNKRISSMQIQYVNEVREGQEIQVVRGRDSEQQTCVVGRDKEGKVHFIAQVVLEEAMKNE